MKRAMKNITINGIILAIVMTCGGFILSENAAFAQKAESYQQGLANNVEMERYIVQTRRKIKDNWYPPVSSFENSAIMVLKIDRKGQLVKCTLSQPSPSEGFNESLLNAAKKVVYSPLPDDYPYDSVEMDFLFSMQRRLKPQDNVSSADIQYK